MRSDVLEGSNAEITDAFTTRMEPEGVEILGPHCR
jgi:hypothetical protein